MRFKQVGKGEAPMRRSTIFSAISVIVIAGFTGAIAHAAPPAPALEVGVLPDPPAGTRLVVPLRELSDSQRNAVMSFQAERLAGTARVRSRLSKAKESQLDGAYAFESDDTYVSLLDKVVQKAVPFTAIEGKVNVKLANTENSAFSGLNLRGYVPEGTNRNGPWTWMSRVYSAPDGSLIQLNEWNFAEDGGGVTVIPEIRNADINGIPAELIVGVSPSGRELWLLRWESSSKLYLLYFAPASGARDTRERILRMGRSLKE
jgi:hypothetical protein